MPPALAAVPGQAHQACLAFIKVGWAACTGGSASPLSWSSPGCRCFRPVLPSGAERLPHSCRLCLACRLPLWTLSTAWTLRSTCGSWCATCALLFRAACCLRVLVSGSGSRRSFYCSCNLPFHQQHTVRWCKPYRCVQVGGNRRLTGHVERRERLAAAGKSWGAQVGGRQCPGHEFASERGGWLVLATKQSLSACMNLSPAATGLLLVRRPPPSCT